MIVMNNVQFNIEAIQIQKEYQISNLKRKIRALTANIQNEKAMLRTNDSPMIQSNLKYDSRRMLLLQQHLLRLKSEVHWQ